MFDNRSIEFFEAGPQNRLAMRNLTVFVTILIGSVAVILMAVNKTLTAEIFIGYLLVGGGVYSFGKWQDAKTDRSQIDADATPANVNIKNIENADSITKSGDVKIGDTKNDNNNSN